MKIYDINKEELIDYYINQKHNIKECAEYFNSDYTHICTVLKGYGIKKNKSITNKKITIFHNIDKEEFIQYYIIENHTKKEAANYFCCSKSTIERFAYKNNIVKSKEKIIETLRVPKKYIIDEKSLYEYYKIQKHTQAECAKYFNVPKNIIRDNIKRNGWEFNEFIPKSPNIDELYDYYVVQNHSNDETAEYFNISSSTIWRVMRENDLEKSKKLVAETRKNTCLSKYGVESTSQVSEFRKKAKETMKREYGSENPMDIPEFKEKIKKTCLQKYGVDCVFKVKEIHDKCIENSRKSLIEKYGVPYTSWIGRGDEYISIVSSKDSFRNFIIKNGLKTKKDICEALELSASCALDYINKYNAWDLLDKNVSQPEEDFYKYLCKKYGDEDIFREYNEDSRYPFRCDFYIKSIDTFVELNLYITHGIKPYVADDPECIKYLKLYEERAKAQSIYYSVIDNWTIRDVIKIKTAKDNNLKYVMYYKNDNLYDGRV